MGQSVEVVVSELQSASARLDQSAARLQDGLSRVDGETTQLLGSGWMGGAAAAYAPAWDRWQHGAGQVVQGLQRMSELLTVAAKEYAKTDDSASGAFGSAVQGASSGGRGGADAIPSTGTAPREPAPVDRAGRPAQRPGR